MNCIELREVLELWALWWQPLGIALLGLGAGYGGAELLYWIKRRGLQ